jgi:glycosyltransferase involved in cell wall biosynthesis
VTFAGRLAPLDIWRAYAAADIYVQTPNIDNMPSSILEAYASGLPVVSTDAGGVPAILTHDEHGLLAPVGQHEEVARQIARLLDEPELADRLARQARAACDAYIWPTVRAQWVALYRGLSHATAAPALGVVGPEGSR